MSQPANAEAPARGALYKVALVWAGLAALIPVVFGVIMLGHHERVTTPGAQAADVFRAMACRNFVFSAALVAALAAQPRRVVAVLLALRGLTEWADGLSGVFVASPGAAFAPYLGGLGDVLFAYYLYRRAE